MSEAKSDLGRRWEVARVETVILAVAIVACSVFVGNRLEMFAKRPTDFAACAEFAAEWAQRREGLLQPVLREQLVASLVSREEAWNAAVGGGFPAI